MKKFIVILLSCISILTFFILYNDYKENTLFNLKNIENNLSNSNSIIIPNRINNFPRQGQYEKLLESSKSSDVNMYFSRIDQNTDNEKIIKYIYSVDNEYMDEIKLVKGRKLEFNDMTTNYFLSTKDTGDPNQIGQIACFDDTEIEIRTLRSMLDEGYILDGPCTINSSKKQNIDNYIKTLQKGIGIDELKIEVYESSNVGEVPNVKYYQIGFLFTIFALIILYNIIESYKKIAIEKMLGYSLIDIWKESILYILKTQVITILLSSIVMSIILVDSINVLLIDFFRLLSLGYIVLIIATAVIASIPFLYVKNIEITNLIKNKQPVKDLIITNTIVKIGICIVFIFLINQQVSNYSDIKKAFDSFYKRWESVNKYKTLELQRLTEDKLYSSNFINDCIDIYKEFNEKGAIFASFQYDTALSKELNKNVPDIQKANLVNPNYLKENPIYNVNGEQVSISENNSNWVLLFPEDYRKEEKNIMEYYKFWIDSFGDEYKADIELIWIKSNQKCFTYNFDVNPGEGNYVTNPILFVGTNEGGYPEWNSQIFNIVDNPFMVKVNNEESYKEEIMSVLSKYGMDSYGVQINYANEQVASSTKNYKDMFIWLISGIVFCIAVMGIIIIQNINNFSEQYKVRWALKQLHGYNIFQKYKEYFLTVFLSWIIVILSGIFLLGVNITTVLIVVLIGLFIEILVSILVLTINQSKRIANLIKGGM